MASSRNLAKTLQDMGSRGSLSLGATIGTVVSTNDPQQMGRLYVHCVELGDPPNLRTEDIEQLPLCTYISPFAGFAGGTLERGAETGTTTAGSTPYGFWAIPRRGDQVLVMCIDGDPSQRVWIGAMYGQFVTNALPHGRYWFNENEPEGPMNTSESKIQPLYDNQTMAFKTRVDNFEWRSRGADYQTTAVQQNYIDRAISDQLDDYEKQITQEDGSVINHTQGYTDNRDSLYGGLQNPESSIFAWTTPGFHGISMDDRVENCRVRFRTTAGTQILMDDTNERVYINTYTGNTWIEIDADGSVDIFTAEKLSATAKHINLTAEETVRIYGKQGIHLKTDGEMRVQVGGDYHSIVSGNKYCSTTNLDYSVAGYSREVVSGNKSTTVIGAMQTFAKGTFTLLSNQKVVFNCVGFDVKSAIDIILLASGGSIFENGITIRMNSASAPAPATATQGPNSIPPKNTFFTNRYPLHEPWARTSTINDFSHEPKYKYTDPMVGREHKRRGTFWRR